ncbi:hypothetical protein MHYP_G00231320 [Metynnis hypsauchen]
MRAAQAACKQQYNDLASVYNDEDNANLAQFLKIKQKAWIGLYRNQSRDKWSNGDDVTFSNLTGVCGSGSCCAAMKADGSWESLNCTEKRQFMCYKRDVGKETNYYVISENTSWYEAQSYCRKNYTDLVSIRDQNQNEAMRTERLKNSTSFWIGLLRDDWEWTDGGCSAYRNWATGQPRLSPSDCAVMMNTTSECGKWFSVPCSNVESALCYFINTTDVPPTVPDGLNISEKKIAYMTEAQAPCITNDTDHIIVCSDDDNAELALKIESGKKAWLGLCRGQSSDKWSNGDEVTFSNLTGVCGSGSCCAAMKADGSWESLQCTEKRNYMCYKQETDLILNYHLILDSMSWYEAQSHCRKIYTDLVSIRDQNQNEAVRTEGLKNSTSFWIGLLCDDWEWTDGGRSAYRNWATGQPEGNLNCTVMTNSIDHDGQWYSVACDPSYLNNTAGIGAHSHIVTGFCFIFFTLLSMFYNIIC